MSPPGNSDGFCIPCICQENPFNLRDRPLHFQQPTPKGTARLGWPCSSVISNLRSHVCYKLQQPNVSCFYRSFFYHRDHLSRQAVKLKSLVHFPGMLKMVACLFQAVPGPLKHGFLKLPHQVLMTKLLIRIVFKERGNGTNRKTNSLRPQTDTHFSLQDTQGLTFESTYLKLHCEQHKISKEVLDKKAS